MLMKVLKYDLKSTAHTFLPLYGVVLIASFLNRILSGSSLSFISGLVLFFLVIFHVMMAVMTITFSISYFNKNLLRDEGYLMFTLPVSPSVLVGSKLITSSIWLMASILCVFFSMFLIYFNWEMFDFIGKIFNEFSMLFSQLTFDHYLLIFNTAMITLLTYISFFLMVYCALTIGQMPFSGKYKGLAAVGVFIGLYIIIAWIGDKVFGAFNELFAQSMEDIFAFHSANIVVGSCNIFMAVVSLILFMATCYILKKKLNLS